jgi:hypothetical protein
MPARRVIAEWLAGAFPVVQGHSLREDDLGRILGRELPWRAILGKPFAQWLTAARGDEIQAETPLNDDDIAFLREGPSDPIDLAWAMIGRKEPRWLMGWRDISLRSVERTVIGGVIPKLGVGNNLPVWHLHPYIQPTYATAFLGIHSSLIFDLCGSIQDWR